MLPRFRITTLTLPMVFTTLLVSPSLRGLPQSHTANPGASVAPATTSDTTATAAVVTPHPAQGTLDQLLREYSTKSQANKQALIIDIGAKWCVPCHGLERALRLPALTQAFTGATRVYLDYDEWVSQFAAAGLTVPGVPKMFCIDRTGRPVGQPWAMAGGVSIPIPTSKPMQLSAEQVAQVKAGKQFQFTPDQLSMLMGAEKKILGDKSTTLTASDSLVAKNEAPKMAQFVEDCRKATL